MGRLFMVWWVALLGGAFCAVGLGSVARAEPPECSLWDSDCYLDAAGEPRRASRAYQRLHARPEANHLRALSEEVLFLGVGTGWYWLARKQNLFDWDFPSAKERITAEAMRFDNNRYPVNFVLHPLSGSGYYATARHNDIGLLGSALYGLGHTIAWEYGVEFREKVSVNDLLFTPLPGITLGEFYSKLARYLNRPVGSASRLQKAVGWLLGPLRALHDVWDDSYGPVEGLRDELGYSAEVFHQFALKTGLAVQRSRTQGALLAELCAAGRFVDVPAYRRPGHFRAVLRDADFSRLSLCTRNGADGNWEFDLHGDTLLVGYFEQRIEPSGYGGGVLIGTSLGWRYRRVELPGFRDDVAVTELPGLALEGLVTLPVGVITVSTRVHPEFGGVYSASHESWEADHPELIEKTTLERHQYLYSFGGSAWLDLLFESRWLHAGANVWAAYLNSKENLDRDQEELTRDVRGDDVVLDFEGFARVFPWRGHGVFAELSAMTRWRRSRLASYVTRLRLARGALRIGVAF